MSQNTVTLSNILEVVSQRVGAPGLRKLGLVDKDLPSDDDEDEDYIPEFSKDAATTSSEGIMCTLNKLKHSQFLIMENSKIKQRTYLDTISHL